MRIAFIGQARYFRAAAFEGSTKKITGKFIDLDDLGLTPELILSEVIRFKPNLIIFFRPDFFQDIANSISNLKIAPVIGYLSEPVGRTFNFYVDNLGSRRRNLKKSLKNLKLNYVVCYTDDLAKFVSKYRKVHSIFPMPVNDNLFEKPDFKVNSSRILFIGRLNDYRIDILNFIKHV